MEHKGWYALPGSFFVFPLLRLQFWWDAVPPIRIPLGMRPVFAIFGVPARLGRCLRGEGH